MDKIESLNHTKWNCKYHVVFIPKGRRKVLYGELRKPLGEVLRAQGKQDRGGAPDARSRTHDYIDSAEVRGVKCGGVHQRKDPDTSGTGVRGEEEELCGTKLLGPGGFVSTVGSDEEVINPTPGEGS